jgi:hypothetical protein
MFERRRKLYLVFILVLLWRVGLLVFTVQPIPANDAFFFDGAVVNWLHHGPYVNPSLSEVFPISGHQVYSAYPPLYQAVAVLWMSVVGTSVVAAIALHLVLFATSGFLVLAIIRKFFPDGNFAVVGLLFLGITFGDRPEDLAHVFGLISLYFVLKYLSASSNWRTEVWILLALLATLYTSVIAGAMYFGIGFLAASGGWLKERRVRLFFPYVGAAVGFGLITASIAHFTPLYWHGFLENARQTPVLSIGFHRPQPVEVVKLIRTAPVFLLVAVLLPVLVPRIRKLPLEPWLCLFGGVFIMGSILLMADMVLLAPNYVMYVLLIQVILAAGLIRISGVLFPGKSRFVSVAVLGCALLLSVRAAGMSTWGVLCAMHNSYGQTRQTLKTELEPFSQTNAPVIISSPFLYSALEFGVRHPIHFDWYFDRVSPDRDADYESLVSMRPTKIIVTQFDYYRSFVSVEQRLRNHPELVEVRVRNDAIIKPPDASPSLQRVVQHISWAPVIVDLDWK